MQLKGPAGDAFSLKVAGYQFPEITDDVYDSNWLLVDVAVTVGGRTRQARQPCLDTYELADLIDWTEALSAGEETEPELYFCEPNLRFDLQERAGDRVRLRVFFDMENQPKKAPASASSMPHLYADLECTPEELRAWAEDLRAQLSQFPPRGGVEH